MTKSKWTRGSTSGFTLIEFLIAATLLTLMGAVVFGSLRVALNSYTKSQDILDAEGKRRALENLVRRQLGSLYPLMPLLNVGGLAVETLEEVSMPGTSREINPMQSQSPLFYGSSTVIVFVTVAPFDMLRKPGLTVVRYGQAEDEWGNRYFGAMENRYTGPESFYEMIEVPQGKPIPIIENVDDLAFEYYLFDQQSGFGEWYQEWSALGVLGTPNAIRITAGKIQIVVAINATGSSVGNSQQVSKVLFGGRTDR